jgi:protein subunit release factor A
MNDDNIVDNIINQEKIEPSEDELETFKNLVNDWFKYDDQIRKLKIAMKERKNYQRVLNNKIEEFMFNFKYNDLNTQHGRIKTNVKECIVPIKMNDIKTKIIQYKELSGEELLSVFLMKIDKQLLKKILRE